MNRQMIILSENEKKKMRRLSNPILQNHILLQMVDFLIAGHIYDKLVTSFKKFCGGYPEIFLEFPLEGM